MENTNFAQQLSTLKSQQNYTNAILAGLVSALIGASLWGLFAFWTGLNTGFVAIAVGLIVGFSVRIVGKGIDPSFGFIGAGFAIIGCLLGNYFATVAYGADLEGLGFFEVLSELGLSGFISISMESFSIMDLLFYGIAAYEGYRFSFSSEEQLKEQYENEAAGIE